MQISYASSSSVLSDKMVYPSLFRTAPSDEVLVPALAILVNYYGWKQVAIVTETSPQLLEVCTYANIFLFLLLIIVPIIDLHLHDN